MHLIMCLVNNVITEGLNVILMVGHFFFPSQSEDNDMSICAVKKGWLVAVIVSSVQRSRCQSRQKSTGLSSFYVTTTVLQLSNKALIGETEKWK